MSQKLIQNLKAAGKATLVFDSPDGTKVLMLPYGGRVLGLFAPGSSENFYWTNPSLNSVKSAKAFLGSSQWQNTGGDRTWLAPEVDFFFPNFPKLDKYFQPRQFDPGHYKVVKKDGRTQLVNRFTVGLTRSKKEVTLEITKSVGPAPNPLRYEKGISKKLAGVKYAGYTQFTSLELIGNSTKTKDQMGLWNLVQMPNGGDLLVPTYAKTKPKIYFGNIPARDLIAKGQLVRYKMRAPGEQKIGIRAIATAGRVGYIYPTGKHWALIIRNFTVNPSGEYVDVPWKDTGYLGYSTQACNVNSGLGHFSELEYHIPAIGGVTGRTRCDDTAQVWAFRGSKAQIRFIAKTLLSPSV